MGIGTHKAIDGVKHADLRAQGPKSSAFLMKEAETVGMLHECFGRLGMLV